MKKGDETGGETQHNCGIRHVTVPIATRILIANVRHIGVSNICVINCGIRHVTVPIAIRILIANVRHIGVSNICVINLVYFKMQV